MLDSPENMLETPRAHSMCLLSWPLRPDTPPRSGMPGPGLPRQEVLIPGLLSTLQTLPLPDLGTRNDCPRLAPLCHYFGLWLSCNQCKDGKDVLVLNIDINICITAFQKLHNNHYRLKHTKTGTHLCQPTPPGRRALAAPVTRLPTSTACYSNPAREFWSRSPSHPPTQCQRGDKGSVFAEGEKNPF